VNLGGTQVATQPLQDLTALRQFLTGNGVFAVFDAPWLPIYLLIMFLFHPLLGWLGVFASILLCTIALLNQRSSMPALAQSNHIARSVNAETHKALRNAEVAAAMGMMKNLRRRWRSKQNMVLENQEVASNIAVTYSAITKTTRLAIQSAAIAMGAFLVISQEISPGMLIGGSLLVARALQPVELAVGAWRGFLEAREQFNRLNDVLEKISVPEPKMALPEISGHLTAERVATIAPGTEQMVLANVNFEVKPGQLTLVMGASGAGKSSLIRTMLGLWPTSQGAMRIDGAESSNFDREELGSQLGYLPQDIELFQGTVSENIARFGEIDSDAVIQAARDAGVHEFILALKDGYETVIDRSGGLLSPGQRQRIGLARALYGRPKLVILDEPNSNLDEDGDNALKGALRLLKTLGSTVVVVTHRQYLIPMADQIIIMGQGTVVISGTAAEVLQKLSADSSKGASSDKLEAV
jgi:ATP-binding cassette subfamily C protein EexD